MPASVITISAQLGTYGTDIARLVAQELDYRYYDREIIIEAASLAGVSPGNVANAERWPGFVDRMLEGMARSSFSGTISGPPILVPPMLTMTSADYRGLIEYVVKELAKRGQCVIVGHAAQAILDSSEFSVFKALIHGSIGLRSQALALQRDISHDEALELIHESDRRRLDLFAHVYKANWLSAELYDITVNSDHIETGEIAEIVLKSVHSRS